MKKSEHFWGVTFPVCCISMLSMMLLYFSEKGGAEEREEVDAELVDWDIQNEGIPISQLSQQDLVPESPEGPPVMPTVDAPSIMPSDDGLIWSISERGSYAWYTSPNLQYVMIRDHNEGRLDLWDLSLDEPLRTYAADFPILDVLINNEGDHFLTTSRTSNGENNEVTYLWDISNEEPIRSMHGQHLYISSGIYSHLTSSKLSDDGSLWLKVESNELISILSFWDMSPSPPQLIGSICAGDEAGVRACSFEENGARLIERNLGADLYLWNIFSTEDLIMDPLYEYSNSFRSNGDREEGVFLASSDDLRKILSWLVDEEERSMLHLRTFAEEESVHTFPGFSLPPSGGNRQDVGATFNSDASQFLTWEGPQNLQLWSINSDAPLASIQTEPQVRKAVFCEDEGHCLTWGTSNVIQLWDIESQEELQRFEHASEIIDVILHPDSKTFASLQVNGDTHVWDFGWPEPVNTFHWQGVTKANYSPSGDRLITITGYHRDFDRSNIDDGLQVWDLSR